MLIKPTSRRLKAYNAVFQHLSLCLVPAALVLNCGAVGAVYSCTQVAKSQCLPGIFRRLGGRGGRKKLHFLHVGKAAGNSIGFALRRKSYAPTKKNRISRMPIADYVVFKYGHGYKLPLFRDNADYFFNLREPSSRFMSGFYSRKREALPKAYIPHTYLERAAFRLFPHANDLAEALSSWNPLRRAAAVFAMLAIMHVNDQLCSWFTRGQLRRRPPFAVIDQEDVAGTMQGLADRMGVDAFSLPRGNIKKHANDYGGVPPLSPRALNNLRRWYAADCRLYSYIRQEFVR